ncbi:hypothetical protein D9758_000580 [Tetrapyrgos nigripes]|uniref:Uncharacterized protein n=1 Tax=Tetrapyrgos nigripes TaxID=182062 RepID=A0A8H5LY41_9AGAR|nr:hypothetical protein D9758_000580 [Tetrapyrgos nigripes]
MVAITFRLVDDKVSLSQEGYRTIPCYLALFALAEIFELLMAFDALRLRNVIQLIGILLFHLACMVFAAVQVHQTRTALITGTDCDTNADLIKCDVPGSLWRRIEPYLIVAPCVIAGSWLFMLFWIRQLYAEFGWAIFHIVGANPKMKTMYQYYQIMICLLKFDFFFFTAVTMQLLIVVLAQNSTEFGVTISAIPVVLVLLGLCAIAVQREIKWLMSISLVLMLAAETYFIYKLVRFYEPSSRGQYQTTRATLTIFTIVAFLILFATFAVGLRCFADFDRGLQSSKVHGGSYQLVAIKPGQLNGNAILFLDVSQRPKYSTGGSTGNMSEHQSPYNSGNALGPRISIE